LLILTQVYGHDPIGVGIRGLPIGFSILAGACIVLVLLSVLKGHIKELLIVSSVLMTAGCGSLAVADVNNLSVLWGLLILAGLGVGGIVVPASIICKCEPRSSMSKPKETRLINLVQRL
jgi:hypothetical protein